MENIRVINFGKTKFFINSSLPSDQDQSFYDSFFDRESIDRSEGVTSRGGRGQTLSFTKDGRELVLRHYKRGGLFGKLVSDCFFFFEPHSHRAYDEFTLLNRMLELNLPVPKPVIAREIKSSIGIVQDIVIEHEIYVIIFLFRMNMLLSGHESISFSEFHQKPLEIIYNTLFKIRFIQ